MPEYCVVFKCVNNSAKHPDVQFHRFPRDEDVRGKWVAAVRRDKWEHNNRSRICSDHFTSDDYYVAPGGKTRRLQRGVVPSRFPTHPVHLQEVPLVCRTLKRTLDEESSSGSPSGAKRSSGQATDDVPAAAKYVNLKKKVKTLQKKVQRQSKKIESMQLLIKDLQDKNLLDSDPAELLSNCFGGMKMDMFKHELHNSGRTPKGYRYPDEIKEFAMTLHYYSPQAYEYCKSIFTLPNQSTLRQWMMSVDGEPGFLTNVLQHIQTLNPDQRECGLVIDSMAIRKQRVYDGATGQYSGAVDYGGLVGEDSEREATEALVFLIVPFRGSWKFPVAYFLVDKVNSAVQTQLVDTALRLTAEYGISVRSLTFDGASANQTMAKKLGCDLLALKDTSFSHPTQNFRVYINLDACHMLKLARNALAEMKSFRDADGNLIQWSFIEKLHSHQVEQGLKLGNKLSKQHIQWYKAKMKVKYAAQAFSTSVADALQFLVQHSSEFKDASPTIHFIRQMDKAFDLLNVRSKFGSRWKAAITHQNIHDVIAAAQELEKYFLSLQTAHSTPLVESRRRTFIVGFITTLKSSCELAKELLDQGKVDYFLTFKLSQDPIETLFSKIRRMGGHNNNPNVTQFRSALKKLIVRQSVTSSKSANVLESEGTTSVFALRWSKRISSPSANLEEVEEDLDLVLAQLSPTQENIVCYIAGYIVRRLTGIIKCAECAVLLNQNEESPQFDHTYFVSHQHLLNTKNRGGLTQASDAVYKVLCTAEKLFRATVISHPGKYMAMKSLRVKLISMFFTNAVELGRTYFPSLTHSEPVALGELCHEAQLARKLVQSYFDIRLKHFTKLFNAGQAKDGASRSILSRLVIFKHM